MPFRSLRFIPLTGTLAALLPTALAVLLPTAIVAQPDGTPTLTADACQALAEAESASDLRDRLDDLELAPSERRITSELTELQWTGGAAFLSATLRGERVEQLTCQSAPAPETATPSGEPHVLCDRIEMGMDLTEVQQALGAPGEQIVGEDGLPVGLAWQWEDRLTGQVAIVAFNNFGEMAGRSCLVPPPIAESPELESPEAEATDPTEIPLDARF